MKTILNRCEAKIKKDKSVFIGVLSHVVNVEEAKNVILEMKKVYPKAKHYVYAYRIHENVKSSDDGEPSGTAGKPLLDLLNKRELDEVIIVVIRYFGGVLLGASRLLATYLEVANDAIKAGEIVPFENRYVYQAELSYRDFELLKKFLNNYSAILDNIVYSEKVTLEILSSEEEVRQIVNNFPKLAINLIGSRIVYLSKRI